MTALIPIVHNPAANEHQPLAASDTLSLSAVQISALQTALGLPDDNQTAAQVTVSPTVAGAADVQTALTNIAAAIPVLSYATAAEIQAGHPNKIVTANQLGNALSSGVDHRIRVETSTSDSIVGINNGTSPNIAGDFLKTGTGNGIGVRATNNSTGGGEAVRVVRGGSGVGEATYILKTGTGTGDAATINNFATGRAIYAYSNVAEGAYITTNGAGVSAGHLLNNGNSIQTLLATAVGGNFGVWTNGNMMAAGTFYASDARLKDKREPIVGALDTIMAMQRPVWYFWNEGTAQHQQNQKRQIGYLAQDVEKHVPEAAGEVDYPLPPVPVDPMSRVPALPVEPTPPEGYKDFLKEAKAAEKYGTPVEEVPGYKEAAEYHSAVDQFEAATAHRIELIAMFEKDIPRYKEQLVWYESQVELSKKLGGKIKVNDLARMVPMLHAALQDLTLEFRKFKASISK